MLRWLRLRVSVGLLFLSLPCCTSIKTLQQYLNTDDVVRIRAGIRYLEDHRAGSAQLASLVNHSSPSVRRAAVLALGRNIFVGQRELLMTSLNDSDSTVRQMAAFSLGQLKQSQAEGALLARLGVEAHPLVRRTLWESLARVGADPTLANIARIRGMDRSVALVTAGMILRRLKRNPTNVPWLLEALSDQAPEVRAGAMYALYRAANSALPEIVQARAVVALESENAAERATAVRLLSRGLSGVVSEVATVLRSNVLSPHQVHMLLGGVALTKGVAATSILIEVLVNIAPRLSRSAEITRPSFHVAMAALDGLKGRQLSINESDTLRRLRGLAVAHEKSDGPAVQRRRQYLDCGYGAVLGDRRGCNSKKLAQLGRTVEELRRLAKDTSPAVRMASLSSLARFGEKAQAYIRGALSDTDLPVVATAASLLVTSDDTTDKLLLDSWDRALKTGDVESAGDILKTLSRLSVKGAKRAFIEAVQSRQYALASLGTVALKALTGQTLPPVIGSLPPFDVVRVHGYAQLSLPTKATVHTELGDIVIALETDDAPLTVNNFINLSKKGFYDGLAFHRVVPNFVVQTGDPRGDSWGGPGYTIRCENNSLPYRTGTVGMALAGKDTGGSQWFITHNSQPHLLGRYTVFARVTNGMNVVDRLVPGDRILSISVHD